MLSPYCLSWMVMIYVVSKKVLPYVQLLQQKLDSFNLVLREVLTGCPKIYSGRLTDLITKPGVSLITSQHA